MSLSVFMTFLTSFSFSYHSHTLEALSGTSTETFTVRGLVGDVL